MQFVLLRFVYAFVLLPSASYSDVAALVLVADNIDWNLTTDKSRFSVIDSTEVLAG